MISRFVANSEKCRKYTFLGGSAQIITILHRGGYRNLLRYYRGGGLPYLLQYHNGGGLSGPQICMSDYFYFSFLSSHFFLLTCECGPLRL